MLSLGFGLGLEPCGLVNITGKSYDIAAAATNCMKQSSQLRGVVDCAVQCSSTCGDGIQLRSVLCPADGRCDELDKPSDRRPCDAGPCLHWVADSWGQVRRHRALHASTHVAFCLQTSIGVDL